MATVLEARAIGKRYTRYGSNLALFASWIGAGLSHTHEFWALRDVSMTLDAGEALGVIGQNGAGKSTLLKLVSGTVRPTCGHLRTEGRVASILELGLGFSGELTGRQNIHHAAGLRGFSPAQVDALLPDIEAFAELGAFFDEPLRVYSSGMQARLAFSLVTAARPDLLIVDEILSVGDSYFQHKSFQRIRQFKEAGTAILLVSHSMADVRALCDRALLLDNGRPIREGAPDEITDLYNARLAEKEAAKLTVEQRRQKNGWSHTRSGSFDATVSSVDIVDAATERPLAVVNVGQTVVFRIRARVHRPVPDLVLGCMIRDRTGHVVWGTNTWHTQQTLQSLQPGDEIEFNLRLRCDLGPGSYALTHALTVGHHHAFGTHEWIDNNLVFDVVNAHRTFFIGSTHLEATFEIKRPKQWARSTASP
ncbi:MAG TPA: ABC transporter ATP-binding protein [Hyphomicrobiaceae bacterium]|nr:ABC transporter ATP-binding protein [Hyphomicrobiaceae bacterium]